MAAETQASVKIALKSKDHLIDLDDSNFEIPEINIEPDTDEDETEDEDGDMYD